MTDSNTKLTPTQIKVAHALNRCRDHGALPSAGDVAARTKLSRSTVGKALKVLTEVGLVTRTGEPAQGYRYNFVKGASLPSTPRRKTTRKTSPRQTPSETREQPASIAIEPSPLPAAETPSEAPSAPCQPPVDSIPAPTPVACQESSQGLAAIVLAALSSGSLGIHEIGAVTRQKRARIQGEVNDLIERGRIERERSQGRWVYRLPA